MITQSQIDTLKKFYAVETDRELIERQDLHIAKLQATVARLSPPEPAYRPVREG